MEFLFRKFPFIPRICFVKGGKPNVNPKKHEPLQRWLRENQEDNIYVSDFLEALERMDEMKSGDGYDPNALALNFYLQDVELLKELCDTFNTLKDNLPLEIEDGESDFKTNLYTVFHNFQNNGFDGMTDVTWKEFKDIEFYIDEELKWHTEYENPIT